MPRNGSGTFTYDPGSGDVVVGGDPIEADNWANPTLDDIGTSLTDSLSRSGLGSMSAPFRAIDGTSGAPGITFDQEQATGWYRAGAADVIFRLNGVNVIRYNAGTMYMWTGGSTWSEVVNSATPTSGFSGFGDGTEALPGAYFASELGSGLFLNTGVAAGVVSVSTNGVEAMRWDNGVPKVENDNNDAWNPVVAAATPTISQTLRATGNGNDYEATSALTISATDIVATSSNLTVGGTVVASGNIDAPTFTGVGTALVGVDADKLGGLDPADYVLAADVSYGRISSAGSATGSGIASASRTSTGEYTINFSAAATSQFAQALQITLEGISPTDHFTAVAFPFDTDTWTVSIVATVPVGTSPPVPTNANFYVNRVRF